MQMNLIVTLDAGYMAPLRVMLFSLCKTNPQHEFDVYVLHSSLQEEHFAQLRETVTDNCHIIDWKVQADKFAEIPFSERWPREACYRIFAAQLLPQHLDRALYLDPDMVILRDLEPLYTIDLEDFYFAAATHMFLSMQIFSQMRLKMPKGTVYINSGVMLFNLPVLRREQKEQDVYNYIQENRKRLFLFDQDILNAMYYMRTKEIDTKRFNLDERYFNLFNINPWQGKLELDWVKQNTIIIHFCGKNKPWNEDYKGIFAELFYQPVTDAMGIERVQYQKRGRNRRRR